MKTYSLPFCLAFAASLIGFSATAKAAPAPASEKPVIWGEMPAGARTTYIGIHGGTVPVSLLSAGDGSPMIAQVGLTGSDFLNFLRNKGKLEEEIQLPDIVDVSGVDGMTENRDPVTSAEPKTADAGSGQPGAAPGETPAEDMPATRPPLVPEGNATLSLAGSPSGDIPVIYATGRAFEKMSLVPRNWAPFGLTAKALALEGEVKVLVPPKKKPRSKRK